MVHSVPSGARFTSPSRSSASFSELPPLAELSMESSLSLVQSLSLAVHSLSLSLAIPLLTGLAMKMIREDEQAS
jgi:hypothetical protein